jgi:hypothetical protein
MKLLTAANMKKLLANGVASQAASDGSIDHKPVVKFFGGGACTWLISEIDADGDQMFGLCDLGQGCPELGYVSLRELSAIRFRFGLGVERDMHFTPDRTIGEYADAARNAGRISA